MREPNLERIVLLADALDSGEFAQGRGSLRNHRDEFCCLGVACEVARRTEPGIGSWVLGESWIPGENAWRFQCAGPEGDTRWLPPNEVRDWYGFDFVNPALVSSETMHVTMTMANDEYEWDFPKIARMLRERYGIPQPE